MENKLICPKCGKEFKTIRARCGHMARCNEDKIECNICHQLISHSNYPRHKKAHNNCHPCLQCGKIISGSKKFCNSSCAAKYNNPKRKKYHNKTCLYCGKEFDSNYKPQKFCSQNCATLYRSKTRNQEQEELYFSGQLNNPQALKKQFVNHNEYKCALCGISEWQNRKLVLILDHIDGNPCNNQPENLRLVCPNCDSQLSTYKSKNRGNGRAYRRKRYAEGKTY